MIRVLCTGLLFVGLLASARADDKPALAPADLPAHVETRHSLALGGRRLDYRAIAEIVSLSDAKGDASAAVYTIAYLAEAPAGAAKRPVAFVFNGGPGAASVFLHLGAMGPRILETPESGAVPPPPVRVVDNPSSWLAFTDMVFVDPVGTGFSRGKGKEENPDKPFWNVRGDLASLAQVVGLWLTRHERWDAAVYLVGESYGGFRAAALAGTLRRDTGIAVSGLVLVSPALDTAILHPDIGNLMAAAFQLPSYAATAAALGGRTGAAFDAAAVERFARSDYLVGLAALPARPGETDPFIGRIAELIGLPAEIVRRERGRVSREIFVRELRRTKNERLSVYDGTLARPTADNPWNDTAGDPMLDPAIAAYTAAFAIHAVETLGYRTERPYRVLPREVSRQWNWDAARDGERGLGLALSSLEAVMLERPYTRLLIAHGRYDLVTPYLASRWLVDQLALTAAQRNAVRLRVYEGGHMMYMRPNSRAALAADAAALFAAPDDAPAK